MNSREAFVRCFREIHPKFSRLGARYLDEAELTMAQYAILSTVVQGGTVPMTELSEKLFISKPAVTHLVDRLESHKFLRRLPHPKDRRSSLIQVLPKGKAIVRDMQGKILKHLLTALKRFEGGELNTVLRFYDTLSQTLDKALMNSRGLNP
ncbi:MAG: MarR family winged helix-turn-helix transcriptional regulator [Candidatus Omnitrophota bacterium]